MGFGLIKVVNKKMEFIQMNELLLQKYDDPYVKLKLIFERTIELIDTYHPDEIAIEAPFYGKNVQSMHEERNRRFADKTEWIQSNILDRL